MKIFDYVVPEQIAAEAVNCIKNIDNKTILDNITRHRFSKRLGGIRPIPANIPLIRKKLEELIRLENEAGMVWIHEGALYGKFTIVLSEKALTDGFEALENTFGTAPILLAMLLDEREPIRELAQKKCEQITEWKQAPEAQEEAQKAFKEIFGPFIDEMSHLLNKPEIKEVVREIKSELPPVEKEELSNLRNTVKNLSKEIARLSQVENELSHQKEKVVRLEEQKVYLQNNERQLHSKFKEQTSEINRLSQEKHNLEKKVYNAELKLEALRESYEKQLENYELRLANEQKKVYREICIEERKNEEQKKNPALEFFAQYNKFFTFFTKAKLIIDGHNVLNCQLNTHYATLETEHKQKRALLKQDIGKLLDYLPNLIINLHFDSPFENSENYKSKSFVIQYSGGGYGEHRADKNIKADYDTSTTLDEFQFTFLVTNDQDIQKYCEESIIIPSEALISFITKL